MTVHLLVNASLLNGAGTFHNPPHVPFGGTHDVKDSSMTKWAIPAKTNNDDMTIGNVA